MKLIIKQYLASLRERDELDAILPDLLSQLGLNVFSKPGRGTRQNGVDVAAAGSLEGDVEKVYLFSIKAGDLSRKDWDGSSEQSLRPSLNEIIDAYIPNCLPPEHKEKDIVICLCFGGDIKEQVRPLVKGYINKNEKVNLTFEEWNGDKLAELILVNFLKEELLPKSAHSQLRKSLALLDEPEASFQHFRSLIYLLSNTDNEKIKLTNIRQINICLWILFSWARESDNLESAYLSSELVVLHSWAIAKEFLGKKSKTAVAVFEVFNSTIKAYLQITSAFIEDKIFPFTDKKHCISNAVQPSCSLDVNLKLFDILGRVAMTGIWAYWTLRHIEDKTKEMDAVWAGVKDISDHIKAIIQNNPILVLPVKDSQVIDISIAVFLLMTDLNNKQFIKMWLSEMVSRAKFSFIVKGLYPCTLERYTDLLEHPESKREDYLEEVTPGSVLFPMISFFAALIEDEDIYNQVKEIKTEHLSHCTFQYWFPCDDSENHFYTNSDVHGAAFYSMNIDHSQYDFIEDVFKECDNSPDCMKLSAVQRNIWPLIFVACRHYRLPIPIHFFQGFKTQWLNTKG